MNKENNYLWKSIMSWMIGMLWIAIPEYLGIRFMCIIPFSYGIYFILKYSGLIKNE